MKSLQVNIRQKIFSNQVCAIRGLEFTAREGEFIAIVGPSGAGKTTLLNIVSGLDRAFDGDIIFDTHVAMTEASHRIGFLFQDSRLMPWLTAEENVQLVMAPGKTQGDIARKLLKQVGLEKFEQAWPGQLSGGMQRRVALARAFAVQPQLLLMDEPFQSLDAPTAKNLRQLLLDLWQQTKPIVLFVTHDLREALSMADRVIFLRSRPASVLTDFSVDLPRPRAIESSEINDLHTELLLQYPALLHGLNADEQAGSENPREADHAE